MRTDELEERAEKSLLSALIAYPQRAQNLLKAIKEGRIDGSEHNAILGFLSDDEEITYIASGVGNHPMDLPPIEIFVLGVRLGDTPENNEELAVAAETVLDFLKSTRMDHLGDLSHEGWVDKIY